MKHALKIMRQSSNEKYEIIRDYYHMDPSHVEMGKSFPTLTTISSYCHVFDCCSGWLVLLSNQVDRGIINEEEFFALVRNWKMVKAFAALKLEEFINLVRQKNFLPNEKQV
jgi:hypothetical protein